MPAILLDQLAKEHYDSHPRELVDWGQWCQSDLPKLNGYLGMFSFTTLGNQPRRFADGERSWAEDLPVHRRLEVPELAGMWPGELRRGYVSACMEGRRSRWSWKDEAAYEAIRHNAEMPSFWRHPDMTRPYVEIDLKAAYWQFVQEFSTQVEYRPNAGIFERWGNDWLDLDNLMEHRQLRTVICSRGWTAKKRHMWKDGEFVELKGSSPHYQPQAWVLLSDIMNSIAQEAVGLWGAIGVRTDSYIVPEDRAGLFVAFLADRWGAEGRAKSHWTPGDPFPSKWAANYRHERSNIREQGELKRRRLAWCLTGRGVPRNTPTTIHADGSRSAGWEPEPEPQEWHRALGVTAWQPLVCPPLPTRAERRHGLASGSQGPYAGPSRVSQGAEFIEDEAPARGPPEMDDAGGSGQLPASIGPTDEVPISDDTDLWALSPSSRSALFTAARRALS